MLATGSIGFAVFLGYRSQSDKPPSSSEAAFLVLAASLLGIASTGLFTKVGRADPSHAKSAVRRLLSTGQSLEVAVHELDRALADDTQPVLHDSVVSARAQLRTIQRPLVDAIQDWNDIHREALAEVLEGQRGIEDS
jgi:hypothetical protein